MDAIIQANEERWKVFVQHTKTNKKHVIIHNYPNLGIKKIKKDKNLIKFQYNGGIRESRCILNIVKAFKLVKCKNVSLYIIGNYHNKYGRKIEEYILENKIKNVNLVDFVPLTELLKIMKKTNVGFVPLEKRSLNNELAEPNKLFNYFATQNLAVVQDTPYMKKIVKGFALTCDFSNVTDIVHKVEYIVRNQQKFNKFVEKSYQKYLKEWNWEHEEKKLIKLYEELSK